MPQGLWRSRWRVHAVAEPLDQDLLKGAPSQAWPDQACGCLQIATYKVRTVRVVDEAAVNDSANENVGDTAEHKSLSASAKRARADEEVTPLRRGGQEFERFWQCCTVQCCSDLCCVRICCMAGDRRVIFPSKLHAAWLRVTACEQVPQQKWACGL